MALIATIEKSSEDTVFSAVTGIEVAVAAGLSVCWQADLSAALLSRQRFYGAFWKNWRRDSARKPPSPNPELPVAAAARTGFFAG